MSITATINSPDLVRQIEVLKLFPEITAKHYRPALDSAVHALEAEIRPNVPRLTGKAQGALKTRIIGKDITKLKGQVGWFGKGAPWYINVVEYGARRHPLSSGSNVRSKYDYVLFNMKKGQSFTGKHVFIPYNNAGWRTMSVHPGFSARGFLAAGFSAAQPIVEREMLAAGDKVVAELAVI